MISLLLTCFIPVDEHFVVDHYDGAVWNVVNRAGTPFTQLLVFTNTRNGLRYEDFRVMPEPPIIKHRKHHTELTFVDPRGYIIRKVYVRTYNVITSNFDIEVPNRKQFPLGHRRNLSRQKGR
jgi:hypothetical protein